MGIKNRVANYFLQEEIQGMKSIVEAMHNAYLEGPFELPPEQLVSQLKELDAGLLDDIINDTYYDNLGLLTGYYRDTEKERLRDIDTSRRGFRRDVITQWGIWLWTVYGFGENISIIPTDEEAKVVWDEFWNAARNQVVLGGDRVQRMSHIVLADGEYPLICFASEIDGTMTVRRVDTKEITEIITDPDDALTPIYYKRIFNKKAKGGGIVQTTLYYPDWVAKFEGWLERVELPPGAKRADEEMDKTDVVMLFITHNVKDEATMRGWPMPTTGLPWSKAHWQFAQDRAAVARSNAMFLHKIKVKGSSRAADSIQAKFDSVLGQGSSGLDSNPPPVAGSMMVENQAADYSKLPMGSGAQDAKADREMLFGMASLGMGMFPHYAGAGDSYRLATACYSEDTEILTKSGWKLHSEWRYGEEIACYNPDTKTMQYIAPHELLIYDYNSPMIEITGRAIDALVTPNHRMLILNENNQSKPWAKTDYEVMEAQNLPSRFALPTSCKLSDESIDINSIVIPGYKGGNNHTYEEKIIDIDTMIEFLGWWIAEGWLEKSKKGVCVVGLGVSKKATADCDAIRKIVSRFPFPFNESVSENRMIRWRCTSKQLYDWLFENAGRGAANKKVPSFIFDLSFEKKRLFLETLWLGDGHIENMEHYRGFLTTTSKQLADDVLRLILEMGEWGSISVSYKAGEKTSKNVKTNLECYVVHRNETDKRSLSSKRNTSLIEYDGKVYCFRVETGFYITRHNGKPIIAGNTAMEGPLLRLWSGYQQFWSAQWRSLSRIVFLFAEKYGKKNFNSTKTVVSTDRLIETDLEKISLAMSALFRDTLTPYIDSGVVPRETGAKILSFTWRTILQALGAKDADEIAGDEAFGITEGSVPARKAKLSETHNDVTEVDHKCPLCGHLKALSYPDHNGLLLCMGCNKTYDPEVE